MLHKKPIEMVSNGVIVRRLLNVGETALYLGVKVDTVYKWSRMGVLSKVIWNMMEKQTAELQQGDKANIA